MTLTDNFMIGKRVEMIEHKSSGGFFDAQFFSKGIDGFDPRTFFFISYLSRHIPVVINIQSRLFLFLTKIYYYTTSTFHVLQPFFKGIFIYVNMTKIAPHNFVLLIGKLVLRSTIMVYQLQHQAYQHYLLRCF